MEIDRRHEQMRKRLLAVEEQIKEIVGGDPWNIDCIHDQEVLDKIEELIETRCSILNSMFTATAQEVERFEKVNKLLLELTAQMRHRTAALYRMVLRNGIDEAFDDDYMVEGTLKYVYNDEDSIISLDNDEYYGSDFNYMVALVYLITTTPRHLDRVAWETLPLRSYKSPDMDDDTLFEDRSMDNGMNWAEGPLWIPQFEHICICYAAHDICTHKPYSILDLLRMNDFWAEAELTCQHIVNQQGVRWQAFTARR